MNEPRLHRAGEWLRAHVEPRPADHARRRAALVEACAREGGAKSDRRWLLLATPTVVAAAAAWFVMHVVYRPTIQFTVGTEKTPGTVGAFVAEAPGASATELRFSDGSSVVLEPKARVRVAGTTRYGAVLSVEDGHARVDVVHRTGTSWSIAAGPYTVDVLGTSFDIGWSGTNSTLDSIHAPRRGARAWPWARTWGDGSSTGALLGAGLRVHGCGSEHRDLARRFGPRPRSGSSRSPRVPR